MEIKQSAVLCRIQTCFPLDELKMGFFFPVFQALTKKKVKMYFCSDIPYNCYSFILQDVTVKI